MKRPDLIPRNNRTKVGNRTATFLDGTDGRSQVARRFRELYADMCIDLGGADRMSTGQHALARRAALLSCECELTEGQVANGEVVNLGPYITATNALRRLLSTLGLERVARDVTPTLEQYLAEKEVDDE